MSGSTAMFLAAGVLIVGIDLYWAVKETEAERLAKEESFRGTEETKQPKPVF